MHIKVDSPEVARMLETAVGAKRMMTFLTERKEDYNLINRELRARSGLGLKFSLVQINNSSNMTGTFSHGQLAEFGRECGGIVRYLNDDVPAPSHMPVMVRSFLQSFVMLHKVIYVKSDARCA